MLIEKIADAVGGAIKPHQIKRVAKAEAEAAIILAEKDLHITDLHRRAAQRWLEEEGRKQENMEAITAKALPLLEGNAQPQNMDNDWVANFFGKCRNISDAEMQQLWSKVLAGEANAPGTYSKRTVNFLEGLDKKDASLFSSLCGFGWLIGNVAPLLFEIEDEIYAKQGINFNSLTHLDNIGLITFQSLTGFRRLGLPKQGVVFYYGTPISLFFPSEPNNSIDTGKVLLTESGQQLARICGSKSVDGFLEYVLNRWVGYTPSSPWPRVGKI